MVTWKENIVNDSDKTMNTVEEDVILVILMLSALI
jgi:hypothetical protein